MESCSVGLFPEPHAHFVIRGGGSGRPLMEREWLVFAAARRFCGHRLRPAPLRRAPSRPQSFVSLSSSHLQFLRGVPAPLRCTGAVTVPTLCQRPDSLPRGCNVKTDGVCSLPEPRLPSRGLGGREAAGLLVLLCRMSPGSWDTAVVFRFFSGTNFFLPCLLERKETSS